ncbi:MAG: membrane protein insertase YidC, partial [Bacteroidales bacterium]|nr:membrane protein insertase YidC [Bacteroidales bacterium]
MDRNSILGVVLIAGILILWTTLSKPSKEEIEAAKHKRDSIELVRQQEVVQQKIEEALQVQNQNIEKPVEVIPQDRELESLYGSFASAGAGTQEFLTLENKLLKVKISSKGGKVYSVELKDYKTYTQKPLLLFDGDSTEFGLNFFSQNRSIITNDLFFVPIEQNSQSVKMRLYAGDDRYIEYVYTLNPESYIVDFDINFVGMNEVVASNLNVIDLKFSMYVPQLEKGAQNENQYTTMGYKYYQDEVKTLTSRGKDESREELNTKLKWVSYQHQFFSTILVADNYFSNAIIEYESLEESSNEHLKHFKST